MSPKPILGVRAGDKTTAREKPSDNNDLVALFRNALCLPSLEKRWEYGRMKTEKTLKRLENNFKTVNEKKYVMWASDNWPRN